MEAVVRTVYGSALQSAKDLGIPYEVKEKTTLNEKFGIQSGVSLPPGAYPSVGYFCIGMGGHQMTIGADSVPLTTIKQHKAVDGALFRQLPFVLRQVGNDLTAAERQKYALRREEMIGGVNYIAYYLKRIDMTGVTCEMELRTVVDGVVTTTPFIPGASVLNPVPTVINNTGVNTVSSDSITISSIVSVGLTAAEVAEVLNVANVLYGDERYAIVSEIGLCSGADKVISVSGAAGGSFNFNEAICVQVASFVSCNHLLQYANDGLEKHLDIGTNEPLFSLV